jgi:hypothetical protein
MATILRFADSRARGCGATVRLPSGEPCLVSVARSSILVKKSRYVFLGAVLYRETDVYKNARTAMALAYLFPDDQTPRGISNPVLRSFFNALLHCSSCAEVCVVINEAVQRAERKARCRLDEIPRADLPAWAREGEREVQLDTTSMERPVSALNKVAEEFMRIVGADPAVKAAAEYLWLPGFIEEPAVGAAFMIVALVAAKKYPTFFGSPLYLDFRDVASKRMLAVVAKSFRGDLSEKPALRQGYSIADRELTRYHDAISNVIQNFIDASLIR